MLCKRACVRLRYRHLGTSANRLEKPQTTFGQRPMPGVPMNLAGRVIAVILALQLAGLAGSPETFSD